MYWALVSLANLHTKYKNTKSLGEFRSKLKAWKCDFCQCRLGKIYLQNLGFILKKKIIDNQRMATGYLLIIG